jgi:TPR repeat protein
MIQEDRSSRKSRLAWGVWVLPFPKNFSNPIEINRQISISERVLITMSSSSPDLALNREWYEIRDALLGQNYKEQNVKRALELAATCRHPDAQWLTGVCVGKDVKTKEEARAVFLAQGNDDARALCFAAVNEGVNRDVPRLRRSAELGFAFAQACMCYRTKGLERFTFASRAAAQGERDGFFWLGYCYRYTVEIERDLEKAKENYLLAAKMQHVEAMIDHGQFLNEFDPQCWYWWGLAAARGNAVSFVAMFPSLVTYFESDPSLAPVVFSIGHALRGHIDEEKREIFGQSYNFDLRIGPANRAIDFFTAQCKAARKAVDAWCLMAVRINSKVNRDIRKKIGMIIWELREQADYVIASDGGIE